MKKKLYALFVSLAFLTCIHSCNSNNNPVISEDYNSEIWPLKINNKWINLVTNFDSLGNPRSTHYDTMSICCDTTVSGLTYFTSTLMLKVWYFNDNKGLWRVKFNPGVGFMEPTLHRKFPCNQGDTFDGLMVVSIDTLINVAYGELSCILYRSEANGNIYIEEFMKPGIGAIKSTIYFPNRDYKYIKFLEFELVDYKF